LGDRRVTDFVPRYFTIEQSLRARIADLEPHAPLPSDAQLCEEFDVSRMTARGAVQRLVQEGLVYRVPGRGTFVAPARANRTASHVLSFSDEMRRRGREPGSLVVERASRAATPDEERRLETHDVFVLRRVRQADGEPVALETAVFPAARVAAVLEGELEGVSVFAALAAAGVVPTVGRAAISAEAATAEDAKLLGVKRGAPLLVEHRLIRDQNGVPFELTESRYVGSRYDLDVDFDVELPT
jgi:GntR family transcriptional regulator